MSALIDLELSIRHIENEAYVVNVRFDPIGSQVAVDVEDKVPVAYLNPQDFTPLLLEPNKYGQKLGEALWSAQAVNDAVVKAYDMALEHEQQLRLRLYISPRLPDLHNLLWETLHHPRLGTIAANDSILFSRYLPALSYQPIQPRPHSDLRALVFAANPTALTSEAFQRDPINVEEEIKRARAGLGNINIDTKAGPGEATLTALLTSIREGYDILYIVAHGSFSAAAGEGAVLLESEEEAGNVDVVYGQRLVRAIQTLAQRPSLVILASCESAGSGATGQNGSYPLAALGPSLAVAGIPAVIAMNGKISMKTIEQLMPPFFDQLTETGQIDQALSRARAQVLLSERDDWWMPVLYMTLKHGKIGWYTPSFGQDAQVTWEGLHASIREGKCTPIIGMGPMESWFGSRQTMAEEWAIKQGYPLAESSSGHFSQVALYWQITQRNSDMPRYGFLRFVYDAIWERYGHSLPKSLTQVEPAAKINPAALNELMLTVRQQFQTKENQDPYTILADLNLPIYLLADPSDLLLQALVSKNRRPQVRIAPWNQSAKEANEDYEDDEPLETPTVERPLLYHLYGRMDVPETLVITEDDYFDFLIQYTASKPEIPKRITRSLSKNALIFLGFHFNDWQFRSFLRLLNNQDSPIDPQKPHIAAQLEPNEQTVLHPQAVRDYLKTYLVQQHFDVFWGRTIDFLQGYQEFKRSLSVTNGTN